MPQASRNLILLVFAVVVVGLGLLWMRRDPDGTSKASQSDAANSGGASGRASISALGRLEPQGGVIAVGGTTGERIDRLVVTEGEFVKAGQELAYLGSYPLRASEKKLAEIQLAEAENRSQAEQAYGLAVVAEAEAGIEQLKLVELDVTALRAKIQSLELKLEIANRDQERLEGAGDVVSAQERDHQQLVVEQAKAELNSTRAQLARLEASRDANQREAEAKLRTAKASQARLQAAVQLKSLNEALTAAGQKVELAVIRAPCNGRILRIVTQPGETVGQRPILQMGDTDHMFAVTEIYETDARFVHPQQRATITSDALTGPLTGTVESVGVTVAKNEAMSLDPTASADARVVIARIRLDDSREASGLVDLQVDVLIDVAHPPGAAQTSNDRPGQ